MHFDPKNARPQKIEYKKYQQEWVRRLSAQTGHESVDDMFTKMTSSKLQSFIENSAKSLSWKEQMFFGVAGWYSNDGDDVRAKKFRELSSKIIEEREAIEDLGEQTEKEKANYLSTEELTALRKNYKNYKTEEEMWIYLILAFITLQPVLRTSTYSSLVIAKTMKDGQKTDDNNYIYYSKREPWTGFFYINHDKVSNTYTHKDHKKVEIRSEKLLKIIDASIIAFPRPNNKVFEINILKKDDKMLALLRKATATIGKPFFNFDMARSAYINSMPADAPRAERKTLARLMRHTVDTQDRNYRKNLKDKPLTKKQVDAKDTLIVEQAKRILELERLVDESAKYKKDWDERRDDVVRKGNAKGASIKATTLEKYGIVKTNDIYE